MPTHSGPPDRLYVTLRVLFGDQPAIVVFVEQDAAWIKLPGWGPPILVPTNLLTRHPDQLHSRYRPRRRRSDKIKPT